MHLAAPVTVRALALALTFIVAVHSDAVTVMDHDANAVAGAKVVAIITLTPHPPALPRSQFSGTSDERGSLPFEIPAIRGVTIIVDHPAFAPVAFADRADAGDIRLSPGERWNGRVIAKSAFPSTLNGEICAHGQIGGTYQWRRCAAVEHGSFEIEGLPNGLVDIDLQIAGYLPRIETLDPRKITALRVKRGLSIRGVVVDDRDLPLGGAMVSAGFARTTTDKEGRFAVEVDLLPADVEVRMRGFRQWKRDIKSDDEFKVRLVRASTISGVLITNDGRALPDVAVEVVRTREDGGHTTLWSPLALGKEGQFVIEAWNPGRYAIALHAAGYREARFPDLNVGHGTASPLGLISLNRGGGIQATVINGSDGKPAGGALIEVVPAGALLLRMIARYSRAGHVSGEDGRFIAAGYETGRYLMSIRRGESAVFHRLVDIERDEIVNLGTITLDRGVEILGLVAASDRESLRDAPVRLFDPAREAITPLATTKADHEGRFVLSRVSPGRYRIEVGGDRLLLGQEIIVPATEPTMELTLHASGGTIRGRVTKDGIPVAHGTLRLVSELDPSRRSGKIIMRRGGESATWGLPRASFATSIDNHGGFVLSGAPAGMVRLWYLSPTGETTFRTAVLSDQQRQLDLDLKGHTIEGRLVERSAGTAVAGTARLLDSDGRVLMESIPAPHGAFRIDDLERGSYWLDARAVGYLPAAATAVRVGDDTPSLTLALEPGRPGQISVTLRRTDGTGVSGVPLTLFDTRGSLTKSLPTDDSGRRLFDEVPPGKYIVAWSDPFAGAGSSSMVQIDASHTPEVSATLERGASVVLRCSLHQCAGAPIGLLEVYSAADLEMSPLLSGITPQTRLSEDGEVSIGRLMPGRYRFRLWVADRQWQKHVTVGSEDLSIAFE